MTESCNVWPQVAVEEKETALDADRRRLAELEVRSASPPVPVIGLNNADGPGRAGAVFTSHYRVSWMRRGGHGRRRRRRSRPSCHS